MQGDRISSMRRVAVFGNAGGGKSTLSRRLADITGLPLFPLDQLKYKDGGDEVPQEQYLLAHQNILLQDRWILDGFGCATSAWQRFAAADTLVYVDLPLATHYWWVTKRLVKGLFVNPEGWPANSPIWRGSMNSYRVIGLCHSRLTPRYRQLVADSVASKQVHHLRSPAAIRAFLQAVARSEASGHRPAESCLHP